MMDWDKATPALEAKLDPARVKKPDSKWGPKGDYIEAWDAIDTANKIFGFGGWSYSILNLQQANLVDGKDRDGNQQWQAAYVCTVRVMVGETIREDVGFGSGFARQIGDAIEGASKEAVTDALKRGLRTYGNQFGLALYDKKRANVGVDDPAPSSDDAPEPQTDLDWAAEALELKRLVQGATQRDYLTNLGKTARFQAFKEKAQRELVNQVSDAFKKKIAAYEKAAV